MADRSALENDVEIKYERIIQDKGILVKGAGGVAGRGLVRCLEQHYRVYGQDDSPYAKRFVRRPYGGEPIDLVMPVPDSLVAKMAGTDSLAALLPPKKVVELCQDKAACAEVLRELAPKTLWVRDTHGAGGKGAQMASEYLPGPNYSAELAFFQGEIVGHFIKRRISYSTKGVEEAIDRRGSSAVSVCVDSAGLFNRAYEAVCRVSDGTAHGAFGVDFKTSADGEPLITEINPGRFLTASYVYFYSTGYNLPLALVKKSFGEFFYLPSYPAGVGVVRQTDTEPWVGRLD